MRYRQLLYDSPVFGAVIPTDYSQALPDGRVQCDACPRHCKLHDGQRGLCFVRARDGDRIVSTTYGRSSGYCIDPIEKKPLNHFLPGTPVLSFGTAGCNLTCRYCQNWSMSKSRSTDTLADAAMPEQIAEAAQVLGCDSVAFTYNDPVIFLEYAADTAAACRERGIRTVAVTAGYIEPGPRQEMFENIDAVNVDLKGFSEHWYHQLASASLAPVLDTISWLVNATHVWVELTTLVVPGHNDDPAELRKMARWVMDELGPNVPWHFSAFHPDFKMMDVPATPRESLTRAREIAMSEGVRFAYTGNVSDPAGDTTLCPGCGAAVIERNWYEIGAYRLDEHGRCKLCGAVLPGVFGTSAGDWGRRRRPVNLSAMHLVGRA